MSNAKRKYCEKYYLKVIKKEILKYLQARLENTVVVFSLLRSKRLGILSIFTFDYCYFYNPLFHVATVSQATVFFFKN